MAATTQEHHDEFHVLPGTQGGGPKGLGKYIWRVFAHVCVSLFRLNYASVWRNDRKDNVIIEIKYIFSL